MEDLKKTFKIKVEPLVSFLRMKIIRLDDGSILVNQRAYSERIWSKFNITKTNSVSISIDGIIDRTSTEGVDKNVPYRFAVGSLMFLVITTWHTQLLSYQKS